MAYAPFHEEFPDIAEKETRMLTVFDLPGLPAGQYLFVEAYCNEPGCDCRRVFFNVFDAHTHQLEAVIAYGWESRDFYATWLGEDNPAIIRELQGPVLNVGSPQSPLAPALLNQMAIILKDKNYVERLKRHYDMYKAVIDKKGRRRTAKPKQTFSKKRSRRHRNRGM
ncbi:MAG: hypothetical protein JXB30_15090 [Anaerolineae bacterium]|nr:hypothetical protein [Anaerolineae bacterium]